MYKKISRTLSNFALSVKAAFLSARLLILEPPGLGSAIVIVATMIVVRVTAQPLRPLHTPQLLHWQRRVRPERPASGADGFGSVQILALVGGADVQLAEYAPPIPTALPHVQAAPRAVPTPSRQRRAGGKEVTRPLREVHLLAPLIRIQHGL